MHDNVYNCRLVCNVYRSSVSQSQEEDANETEGDHQVIIASIAYIRLFSKTSSCLFCMVYIVVDCYGNIGCLFHGQ